MTIVAVLTTGYAAASVLVTVRELIAIAKDASRVLERSPIEEAAKLVARRFSDVQGLENSIRTWLRDPDVLVSLESYVAEQNHDKLALSLVERAGFYMAKETHRVAEEIIADFLHEYIRLTLLTFPAVAVHDNLSAVRHAETQAVIRDEGTKTLAAIADVKRTLDGFVHAQPGAQVGQLVTQGKELMSNFQYEAALRVLRLAGETSAASVELRFDALVSAAKCAVRLDRMEEATVLYDLAAALESVANNCAVPRIRAAVLRKDFAEAMRLADALLGADVASLESVLIKAEVHLAMDRPRAVVDLFLTQSGDFRLPPARDSARAAFLLAHAHYKIQDAAKTNFWAERSLDLDAANPMHRELAGASAILVLANHQLPTGRLDATGVEIAKRAELRLTQVIEELATTDYRALRIQARSNRAAIRVCLGDYVAAEDDCLLTLADDPGSAQAYVNLSHARLLRGDANGAITAFRDGMPHGVGPGFLPTLADGLLSLGNARAAADLVSEVAGSDPNRMETDVLTAGADANCAAGRLDVAEDFMRVLDERKLDTVRSSLIKAHLLEAHGRLSEAEEVLRSVLTTAHGPARVVTRHQLAALQISQGRYDDAALQLADLVDPSCDEPVLRQYVRCLYLSSNRASDIPRCAEVCARVRYEQGPIPYYLRYEAAIAENLGNLPAALELYQMHATLTTGDARPLIRMAAVNYRLDDSEASAAALDRVDASSISDPELLMMLAEGYACCGKSARALDLSYKALRLGFKDPQMHNSYMSLILFKGPELRQMLDAPVAAVAGSAVSYQIEDETLTYLLTEDRQVDPVFHELDVGRGLGARLIGKRAGDTLSVTDASGDRTATVKELLSKYVFMFRDVMDNFSVRFGNESGPIRVKVGTGEDFRPERLIQVLQNHAGFVGKALDEYKLFALPVTALSRMIGRDIVMTRDVLTNAREACFYCCVGTREETDRTLADTLKADSLVFDATAMLALLDLQLIDSITGQFASRLIPRSFVDALRAAYEVAPEKDEGSLAAADGRLVWLQPGGGRGHHRTRLNACITFARDHFTAVGRDAPLSADESRIAEVIRSCSIDAILLAKRRGFLLCTDDLWLRRLAMEMGVRSTHTPALLMAARQLGRISERELNRSLAILVLLNYQRPPIRGAALAEALVLADFVLDWRVVRAIGDLAGYSLACQNVDGLADFYKEMWLLPVPPAIRTGAVMASLHALLRGANGRAALNLLLTSTRLRFQLLQNRLPEVEDTIVSGLRALGVTV